MFHVVSTELKTSYSLHLSHCHTRRHNNRTYVIEREDCGQHRRTHVRVMLTTQHFSHRKRMKILLRTGKDKWKYGMKGMMFPCMRLSSLNPESLLNAFPFGSSSQHGYSRLSVGSHDNPVVWMTFSKFPRHCRVSLTFGICITRNAHHSEALWIFPAVVKGLPSLSLLIESPSHLCPPRIFLSCFSFARLLILTCERGMHGLSTLRGLFLWSVLCSLVIFLWHHRQCRSI
jgi:hypothetical protein